MLDQDQIDAMTEADETLDRVEKRMKEGAPLHRELKTSEIRPFIRAAIMWRRAAINLWDEKQAAARSAMRVHEAGQ